MNDLAPGGIAIHNDGRVLMTALNLARRIGAVIPVKPEGTDTQTVVPTNAGYTPIDLVFDAHRGL